MYPKVLILFETFHHNSGGGITLTNLFKDWDKSSIANSTFFYELENCFGNLICSNYYSLGGKELKANCLFFKFMEFGNSGMIVQNVEQIANSTKGMVPSFISSKFKESVKDIFKFFGFNGDIFSMSISNEFLDRKSVV